MRASFRPELGFLSNLAAYDPIGAAFVSLGQERRILVAGFQDGFPRKRQRLMVHGVLRRFCFGRAAARRGLARRSRGLTLMHREGGYAFVHAGVRPGIALDQQARDDLLRMRAAFLYSETDFGAVVVHGHTPVKHPVIRHNRIAIDTGAVFGGPLTCLVLEGDQLGFLTADPVHEPVSIAHR